MHDKTLPPSEPLVCEDCRKSFTNNKTLLQYYLDRVHKKMRRFECSTCKCKLFKKAELRRHEQTHDTKTFSCLKCKTDYTNKNALAYHQRRYPNCDTDGYQKKIFPMPSR